MFNEEEKLELNPEEIASCAKGIEKLVHLFFKGVEIYPSLEAPKTAKDAFPAQEATLLLDIAKSATYAPTLSLPEQSPDED